MDALKRNLEKRKTPRGWSIFTKVPFAKGDVILEFKGLITNVKPKDGVYLQIGSSTYILASGDFDDMILPSCQPNAYVSIVGNRAMLKALYLIPAKTEVTFDYTLTSTETDPTQCQCGIYECRGKIGSFSTLDTATKTKYMALGIVPSYVSEAGGK